MAPEVPEVELAQVTPQVTLPKQISRFQRDLGRDAGLDLEHARAVRGLERDLERREEEK